jgi:hypothetical protein
VFTPNCKRRAPIYLYLVEMKAKLEGFLYMI